MNPSQQTRLNVPRLIAALGIVVVLGVLVWLIFIRDDNNDKKSNSSSNGGTVQSAVTPADLATLQTTLKHPVYWVGADPAATYELTRTSDGRVYVRYLTAGAKPGDARPIFATVGTYPQENAYATVQSASKRPGATSFKAPGGSLAVTNKSLPTSVYLAKPGDSLLVEVFDPNPRRARSLVRSGKVTPVG